MKIYKIEEPCLFRILKMGNESVFVSLDKPRLDESEEDYYCAYSIEWANDKKFNYAFGVDSVQAMQLAMKKIGVQLNSLAKSKGSKIYWLEDNPADTGFH